MWSLLAGTVASAFKEEEDKHIASKDLFTEISKKIEQDWEKFHFKVYSAAYVLTPMFRTEILELKADDPGVARS